MKKFKIKTVKTERQKLIKDNDDIFREIIRLRDNFTCRRSFKKTNIQVAHYFSRSNLRLRWEEDNAMCLNAGVHKFWAHKYPDFFREFWIREICESRFERLKLKMQYYAPVRVSDLKGWNIFLKNRLNKMKRYGKK